MPESGFYNGCNTMPSLIHHVKIIIPEDVKTMIPEDNQKYYLREFLVGSGRF